MSALPLALLAIGGVTGWLSGLLGAAGAFTTITLLIAVGVSPHVAVGSTLVYTIVIGASGFLLHLRQGSAAPRLALALGLPAALTAVAGARLADLLPASLLTLGCGLITALVAVGFALSGHRRTRGEAMCRRPLPAALAGGSAIGFLKGLLGLGGGSMLVPYLIGVLRVEPHLAVGTALFAVLPGSLGGAAAHAALGNIDLGLLAWLCTGGLTGVALGTRTNARLSPRALGRVLTALLTVSAVWLLTIA